MLTLNYMVYDILEAVRGNLSDDEELDKREIAFHIKNQRALWLRNQFNKGESCDDEVIQDLGAIPLEVVNTLNMVGLPAIPLEKKVLRTRVDIPGTIERHNKPTITYIGSPSQVYKKFPLVDMLASPFVGNGRLNRDEIFAFLLNNRMYIIGNHHSLRWKGLKYLNIRGVFEDPELVGQFKKANGDVCFTWDSAYPMKHWMYTYIKEMIVKNYLSHIPPTDKLNNADEGLNSNTDAK